MAEQDLTSDTEIPIEVDYIATPKFALIYKLSYPIAIEMVQRGIVPDAFRGSSGRWFIPLDRPVNKELLKEGRKRTKRPVEKYAKDSRFDRMEETA